MAADWRNRASLMFILVLSLAWIERTLGQEMDCPTKCRCFGLNVYCNSQSLTDVPHEIPERTKNLTLSHNEMTVLPDISTLPNLAILNLSANNISSVKYGLNYSQLHSLNLSHNNLTSIPTHLFPIKTRLRHLLLNNNHIEALETPTFSNFSSLITLKLNKNKISHIPKYAFKNLTSLVFLDLSRNKLQQLEGLTFEGLKSLQTLNLRSNELVHLSDGTFWGLDRIEKLFLDNNKISSISGTWLYGLTTLKHLSIHHNLVQEISGWEYCKKLVSLDLTYNRLTLLTKRNFHHLGTLKKLLLDYNYINEIEDDAFSDLGSLNSLEMSHNMIPWEYEAAVGPFHKMGKLKHLILSYNNIRFLSKRVFEGLIRLRSLDLSANPISSIQEGAFSHFARPLADFKMNTSSLLCDCTLQWFHKWLSETNYSNVLARCLYPPWFQDMPFLLADPQNFTCDNIPKAIIQNNPPPQILALKGGDLTLTCEATSNSESASFDWRKDGKVLVGSGESNTTASVTEVGMTKYTTHLTLHNITDEDEGHYKCVISNEFGSVYSPSSHITVNVFPYFTRVPEERVEVSAGANARLVCAARGQPPPEVSWRKEGGGDDFPAARERRMQVMPTDEVFFIIGVQAADAGLYSCIATNVAGTAAANVTLTVIDAPSLNRPLLDQEVEAGESVSLDCRYNTGRTPETPQVHWFKDNVPLIPREDHHFFTAGGQILLIVQTSPADSGRYACRLGPEVTLASCYLTVLPPGNAPGGGIRSGDNNKLIVGIVAIAIVCCIVVTSLVWVIIIYKTRGKHALPSGGIPKVQTLPRPQPPNYHDLPPSSALIEESSYLCGIDSHSDDSSKCDSGNGGEQEAFFPTPTTKIKHHSLILSDSNRLKSSAGSSSLGGSLGSLPSCTGKDDSLHWTWVRSMSSHHLPPEEVHFLKLPPESQTDSGSFSIESGKLYNVHHPCT